MSNVVYDTINVNFPIPGVDNSSQGFRSNFSIIHDAFATASTEITSLEQNVLLKGDLATDQPVINDLNGSTIKNGKYNDFYPRSMVANPSATTIDVKPSNGLLQSFEFGANTTLRFIEWPAAGTYAKVRLHIQSNSTEIRTITFANNAGIVRKELDFPATFLISHAVDGPRQRVIEAWSFDGGVTIYLRYLGEY